MNTGEFYDIEPTIENYWRSIILFGRNVASYKFALGKSLLELELAKGDFIRLDELAPRFAHHVCQHLKLSDKQATSRSSKFLDACRGFNRGEVSEQDLIATPLGEPRFERGDRRGLVAGRTVGRFELEAAHHTLE